MSSNSASKKPRHYELYYVDHYDSFSNNLKDWLAGCDPEIQINALNYDNLQFIQQLKDDPKPLVVSPGPGHPQDYAATLALLKASLGKAPILGVCLGHQMLGLTCDVSTKKSAHILHGIPKVISQSEARDSESSASKTVARDELFSGLPAVFNAMSYNSLVLANSSNTKNTNLVRVTSRCSFGEIQSIEISTMPWPSWGVQFHPESFKSADLSQIAKNFFATVKNFYA